MFCLESNDPFEWVSKVWNKSEAGVTTESWVLDWYCFQNELEVELRLEVWEYLIELPVNVEQVGLMLYKRSIDLG